jgi:hypothetical protein
VFNALPFRNPVKDDVMCALRMRLWLRSPASACSSVMKSSIAPLVLAGALFACSPAEAIQPPAHPDNPPPKPPEKVSASQRASFPVFRQPATRSFPPLLRSFARTRAEIGDFAPSLPLARRVTIPAVPGSIAPQTWYVLPARGGMCLFGGRAGSCVPDALARLGKLYLQLIQPSGTSPIPPAGLPVPSTVVGVVPTGVTKVTADLSDGTQAVGTVGSGLYTVVASDVIKQILFEIPFAMPALPGH